MEFICTECNHNEDNELELVVKDGVEHRFKIASDGSLYDEYTEGIGQEIYLECPACGQKYEFENDYLTLEETYVLKKWADCACDPQDLTTKDYKIKKVE